MTYLYLGGATSWTPPLGRGVTEAGLLGKLTGKDTRGASVSNDRSNFDV